MTIVDITNILTRYIEGQPIKSMVTVGSVYENFNTKELKYPIVNFDNVNTIKKENETVFGFTVYYADRLNEDESNLLEIQSQATTALQLLLKNIYNSGIMTLDEFYNGIISPFRMKFADKCAGAWMQVNIHTIGINDCGDFIPSILTITENGKYDVSTYEGVEVDIPRPSGEIDITSNGAYDVELVKKANVMVDPDGNWQSGYTSGYTDGWQSGYTSGHTSGFTEGYQSGYTDGYQSGYTTGYTEGYQSGYTDGVDSVPLSSTAFTENGVYTSATGGWNEVVVNVLSDSDYFRFIAKADNSDVSLRDYSYSGASIEYTVDEGLTWHNLNRGQVIQLAHSGDTVYMRGIFDGFFSTQTGYNAQFNIGGNVKISGNIGWLFNKNNPNVMLTDYVGTRLFNGCSGLTDASELTLPTNFVKPNGYTAQAPYQYMFNTCINLEKAPELPATDIENVSSIYYYMFRGCSSLIQAPSILPATKAYDYAYCGMFNACTSLVEPPKIFLTKGDFGCCQEMFAYCTSLKKAPDLMIEYLDHYAYYKMFQNCTNLEYVRCMATNQSQASVLYMLDGVPFIGTLVLNYNADQELKDDLIRQVRNSPRYWTVLQDNVPYTT